MFRSTESTEKRFSLRLLLVVLAVFAFAATACTSGSESGSDSDDDESGGNNETSAQPVNFLKDGDAGPLNELFVNLTLNPEEAGDKSARYEGKLQITPTKESEIPDAATLSYSGSYDTTQNAYSAEVDYSELALLASQAGQEELGLGLGSNLFEDPLEVVIIEDTVYTKWALLALAGVPEGKWASVSADQSKNATDSFNLGAETPNPLDLLNEIQQSAATIEVLGQETIRKVPTQHVKAVLNLEELLANADDEAKAALSLRFGQANLKKDVPVEFWIDEDGKVRRYKLQVSGDENLPIPTENLELTFELYDFGKDVKVEAPAEGDVIDGSSLNLFGQDGEN